MVRFVDPTNCEQRGEEVGDINDPASPNSFLPLALCK